MSEQNNRTPSRRNKYAGYGMAIGLVFGGLVGFFIGNPIIFAGGTMVLGYAIGTAMDKDRV